MVKQVLFVLSWFVAGGATFYAVLLHGDIGDLDEELANSQGFEQRYREQLTVNEQQKIAFEGQIHQLQSNLNSAQAQMANLSEALQEARETMDPAVRQLVEQPGGSTVAQ